MPESEWKNEQNPVNSDSDNFFIFNLIRGVRTIQLLLNKLIAVEKKLTYKTIHGILYKYNFPFRPWCVKYEFTHHVSL